MGIPAIIVGTLVGGVIGSIVTHLCDRKYITKLQKQVETLQREIKRLRKIILEQQRQIDELKIRYQALRIWAYKEKLEYKGLLKGKILFMYALYEYLKLLKMQLNRVNLSEEEQKFFEIFEGIVNNKFSDEEKLQAMYYIKEFISLKYAEELNRSTLPSINQCLLELGVLNE